MRFRWAPLLFLLVSGKAFAQDDAAVTSAYEFAAQFAAQGLKAYEGGQPAEALDKFSQAYAIVKLPSLAVYVARADVQLGHYVAAAALYAEASQLEDGLGDLDDHKVQQRAREEAQTERQALIARMPRLVVQTPGVPIQSVAVQVDGTAVPSAALAEGWPLDPGMHRVTAVSSTQKLERDASVSDGRTETIVFKFQTATATITQEIPPKQVISSPPAPGFRAMRNATWVSFGAGGAALVFWGVAGLVALEEKPANWACSVASDAYCKWRTLSTIGFYTGLAGAATGAVLLLATPGKQSRHQSTTRVTPWVGLGSAGVQGRF